jgi:hypothetical protein
MMFGMRETCCKSFVVCGLWFVAREGSGIGNELKECWESIEEGGKR